jgi:hypothetical protein
VLDTIMLVLGANDNESDKDTTPAPRRRQFAARRRPGSPPDGAVIPHREAQFVT